jgi:hypothetical protein
MSPCPGAIQALSPLVDTNCDAASILSYEACEAAPGYSGNGATEVMPWGLLVPTFMCKGKRKDPYARLGGFLQELQPCSERHRRWTP